MARTLDSREICSRALRMIGEHPTDQTAPDGEQLREAMFWLDLIMSENAGVREVFHLQPATATLTLVAGQSDYSLQTIMGADFPADGFSFPTDARIRWPQTNGQVLPFPLVKRDVFFSIGRPDETGVPRLGYIDRLPTNQRLLVWPTLPASENQTYVIELEFQASSPDLSPAGVSGARPNDTTVTGLRNAWQRWIIMQLAIALGSGALNKQPIAQITLWERQAAVIKGEIEAFENREHETTPPIADAYGIDDYQAEAGLNQGHDSYILPMGRYRGYFP